MRAAERSVNMIDERKLEILTESAKYDVSCSSSGSSRKNVKGGVGNASYGGICHSFTQDGRCISLLKILLSNKCVYDCLYCVNRRSNDVPRESASPEEICELVMNFYRRNYIEGLFLSSAVERSPDYTMERLLEVVMRLRKLYCFHGYIHLKGIPGASKYLLNKAAKYVDRMSCNIELPSEKSLKLLAPQKSKTALIEPMGMLAENLRQAKAERNKKFLPAGQTTQMIVGASRETDGQIIRLTQALYKKFDMKRVYFSSYIPTNFTSNLLPARPAGLLREHRLYQADWLMRFYGFRADEISDENEDLDLTMDPKCRWALRHPEFFPVEVNAAPPEVLLRVPGIGFKSAYKIVSARKYSKLDFCDLVKLRVVLKRAAHFVTCGGKFIGDEKNAQRLLLLPEAEQKYEQLSLFSSPEISLSALTGQL